MVDQEQTTATETNETTTTEGSEADSTSSTTEQNSSIDLAAGTDDGDTPQQGGDDKGQQEDTRTDEQKAADEERATLFGAPEADAPYEITDLPEGMEIDKDALDAVTPVFRKFDLSSKGASEIAKVYAEKVLPQVMERATSAIEQQVVAQRSAWEGEARQAIKNNGHDFKNAVGEVLSFDAKDESHVLKTAAKALDQMAPAGFREWLKETGLSVHPMMVAFAYQAGRSIAEDTDHETAATGSGKPKSRVEKYYS